jgi:hypothetical protein
MRALLFLPAALGFFLAIHHFFPFGFLAVLAASRNAFAVGAPFEPGLRIRSSEPRAMRRRFAWMFA